MPFTSPLERVKAPSVAPEKEALAAFMDYQRQTLLWKLEGLDDEQLRRPMVPSDLRLLGIVKHMICVEHWWFAINFARADEEIMYSTDEDPNADFRIEPDETTDDIIEEYLQICERSRKIVADAKSLDEQVPNERRGQIDLRWILLHMIEEYARHNGHADILRELIDGVTGD